VKSVEWYRKEAERLGIDFVEKNKKAILEKVEAQLKISLEEIKYIYCCVSSSWNEKRTNVAETYSCVIYKHKLYSIDDEITDILKPIPEKMKTLYVKVGGKCISVVARLF
jgi:hypothetical protein